MQDSTNVGTICCSFGLSPIFVRERILKYKKKPSIGEINEANNETTIYWISHQVLQEIP